MLCNMLFQKISIPLPRKVFQIETPTPPEIPFSCYTFIPKILLLKPPYPLEFPLTFHGVGMDIFWNYIIWVVSYLTEEGSGLGKRTIER